MQKQQLNNQYQLYPKRYLIVFLFALIQMMSSILSNTLTPIASYLAIIYNEDPVVVNLAGLLFTLMHPIFTFPAAFVIDTYGTRIGICIGCILCLLGTVIRLFINETFVSIIIGQIIAGIGRPFILNCQAKVSANWFPAETRGGITQLLSLVLNVSLILGIFIPGLMFGGYKPNIDVPQNIQQGKDLTFNLMAVQLIMAAVCFLPNIIFQVDKPPTSPSESSNIIRQPFSVAISRLMKNPNYILLMFSFGFYFGIFNGISIVLSYLIQPWFEGDGLPLAVACVGGSPIISGIIGVMIIGPIQRKSGEFKKYIVICMIGSCTAIIIFYPLLETGSLFLASFASAYNSFFLIPLVPIMIELSCELAFPVGQGSAAGLLFAVSNLFGFLLGLIMSLIVQGEKKSQSAEGLGFCLGVFLLGLVLIYFMKEEKNRMNFEKEQQEKKIMNRSSIKIESTQQIEKDSSDKQDIEAKLLKKEIQEQLL